MTAVQASMAAIGENCIDVYLSPLACSAVGGNAVNVAVRWARAGQPSIYLGAVGDDDAGLRIKSMLKAELTDARIATLGGATGITKIALGEGGDRRLVSEDFGVSGDYLPAPEEIRALADCTWVHCTLPVGPDAVRAALPPEVQLSYDFSTRHDSHEVAGLAVAFLSWHGRPDRNAVALAKAIVGRGAVCAVLTCGRHGSLAYDGDRLETVDALAVDPVDTLGAGDAYIASFIAERAAGRQLWQAMEVATKVATEACRHLAGFEQQLEALTSEPTAHG